MAGPGRCPLYPGDLLMARITLTLMAAALVLCLVTGGLVLAADRAKFPTRRQGGGGYNLPTEQPSDHGS